MRVYLKGELKQKTVKEMREYCDELSHVITMVRLYIEDAYVNRSRAALKRSRRNIKEARILLRQLRECSLVATEEMEENKHAGPWDRSRPKRCHGTGGH